MNWPIRFLIPLFLVALAAQIGRLQADEVPADLSNLVIVGDSISAGYQNSCLVHTQQPNGYASLLAKQAGIDLTLPLVEEPGLPPCLELVSLDPPVIIRPTVYPGFRIDPSVQAHNLSVPGMRIVDALKDVPDDTFHDIFGFPFSLIHNQVLQGHSPGKSPVAIAESLMPTTVVLWLGSNDVLWALIGADPIFITPQEIFEVSFKETITRLANTGATVVVGNVPNVSVIPFGIPAEGILSSVSENTGVPEEVLSVILGIAPGDRVTLPGLGLIPGILGNPSTGPLPPDVVLTAEEAAQIQAAVDNYNDVIREQVDTLREAGHRVALVDTNAMLGFVDLNGVTLGGRRLTTEFLGGLFTLDGIHPTNTAHAILANAFINVLNAEFNANIRPLSVGQINKKLHNDSLVFKNVGRPISVPGSHSVDVLGSLDFIRDPIMAP